MLGAHTGRPWELGCWRGAAETRRALLCWALLLAERLWPGAVQGVCGTAGSRQNRAAAGTTRPAGRLPFNDAS